MNASKRLAGAEPDPLSVVVGDVRGPALNSLLTSASSRPAPPRPAGLHLQLTRRIALVARRARSIGRIGR
jgi:hypothetical protein